jgi:hypothetical protein
MSQKALKAGQFRTRMSWEWIEKYPIFVYTTWIEPNHFLVKMVKGKKGDQNASGYGPGAKPWTTYHQHQLSSKDGVVAQALKHAEKQLKKEGLIPRKWKNPLGDYDEL